MADRDVTAKAEPREKVGDADGDERGDDEAAPERDEIGRRHDHRGEAADQIGREIDRGEQAIRAAGKLIVHQASAASVTGARQPLSSSAAQP